MSNFTLEAGKEFSSHSCGDLHWCINRNLSPAWAPETHSLSWGDIRRLKMLLEMAIDPGMSLSL